MNIKTSANKSCENKAFTLVETLIMVGVIGIIAIITIVSMRNMRPDKDYMMIRKAYSETAKAVATLANDDELYPVQKTAYKPDKLNKYLTALINRQLAKRHVVVWLLVTDTKCVMVLVRVNRRG